MFETRGPDRAAGDSERGPPPAHPPSDQRASPLDLFGLLRRHAFLIGVMPLLFVAAALIGLDYVRPLYTATTQLMIDPIDLRVTENDLTQRPQVNEMGIAQVESQVRVLRSDSVLRRVVQAERLDQDPEFNGSRKSFLDGAYIQLRFPVDYRIGFGGPGEGEEVKDPALTALRTLRRRLSVRREERTYVVELWAVTESREKSVRLADAVARAYLDEQAAARAEVARRVTNSLAGRLDELRDRVRQAEDRVERYKAENNILGSSGQLVNEQQLTELNNQLVGARARAAEAQARFEQIRRLQSSRAEPGAIAEAVSSATVSALRTQYARVTAQRADALARLGPRHPAVVTVEAQARDTRRLINEELGRIAAAARSDFERAKASEESLSRSLESLKQDAVRVNQAFVRLRELERDVEANRGVYQAFLNRAREVSEQEQLDVANVRVISTASPPQFRSWPPRRVVVLPAAAAAGLMAGFGLAFLADARGRRRAPSRDDGSGGAERPAGA